MHQQHRRHFEQCRIERAGNRVGFGRQHQLVGIRGIDLAQELVGPAREVGGDPRVEDATTTLTHGLDCRLGPADVVEQHRDARDRGQTCTHRDLVTGQPRGTPSPFHRSLAW